MINNQVFKNEKLYEEINDEIAEKLSGGQDTTTYGIYVPPGGGSSSPSSGTGITATQPGETFTCKLDAYGRATSCTSQLG